VKLVYPWLRELVDVPVDPDRVASEIALRGFEVASIEHGRVPVIDFEITANRPDCLSHVGLAREAATIWGVPLRLPDVAPLTDGDGAAVAVRLEDADLCPRYCAQVFEVRIGPSPEWLRDRLDAAGVRPINNIVDVTNYVMLEMGQPMHAFDLDRLAGGAIVVRRARPGERMRTLDGVERTLDAEMLVIADAERSSALGGVMGGGDSEISDRTTRIALESAYFHPPSVRRTSKRLGLKTEASTRFERGADIEAPPVAIGRAAALFSQLGAGHTVGPLVDRYPAPRPARQVMLRASRIAVLLGQSVPEADIARILEPLGFHVTAAGTAAAREWLVTVPSFRVDVTREADLIEEVGRHYGFDRLPTRFPPLTAAQAPPDPAIARERLARQVLTAAGFSESMTFAFIERQAALPFVDGAEPAEIANPLSEKFAVLRPSLLPGLLDSCVHNRRRERRDVQLFETGSRFIAQRRLQPDGTRAVESRAAGFAWCGAASAAHWSTPLRTVDFFDAKGVVEAIAAAFGITADFLAAERGFLVPGRTADVVATSSAGSVAIGVVGEVSPAVAEARGFPPGEPIYVAELDLTALGAAADAGDLRAEPLPRYPSIVRDISILVAEALPAAAVRGTIRAAAPPTLVSIIEFDRYQGKGVPEGRVSLSLRLTFRAPDRTLTDEEAQAATDAIVAALRGEHHAERR
jgi:phenylalanyl-tRNA synthetase beta chain